LNKNIAFRHSDKAGRNPDALASLP